MILLRTLRILFNVSTLYYLTAMAIQPDGKIILAGTTYPGTFIDYSGPSLGFGRFYYTTYSDGSNHFLPDPSFGTNGIVIPYFGSLGFVDYSAALQSDDKIVAVGEYGGKPNGYKYTLARFNNDGSLDTTFGTNGLTITDFSDISDVNYNFLGNQSHFLAIQPDGKLVVAGDTSDGHFFLACFNSNGSLDTTFGTAGEITTAFGTADDVRSVVLQPDGKIIAAGSTTNGTNTGIALARYVVANVNSSHCHFHLRSHQRWHHSQILSKQRRRRNPKWFRHHHQCRGRSRQPAIPKHPFLPHQIHPG